MLLISVVVPIFNEEENLPTLRARLTAALDHTGEAWEVILVNDGSRDRSPEMLRQLHAEDPRFKLVHFSRNFGHQPAVTAGVHFARGDCVVLIDGDLQDPPEVIPAMVEKWKQGFAVVIGERSARANEGLARNLGFKLFYPIWRMISDLPTSPDAGIFGLMDRKVVDEFNKLPERNRFIPGLRAYLGFRQGSVTYERQERAAGAPKQTLRRLIKYAMNGIVSFSTKPLRVATYIGLLVAISAFGLGLFYVVTFFTMHKFVSGFTTTIVCVLFLGGVQLVTIGILGEYIGRIYEEIKQRPLYVVEQTLGIEGARVEK